MLLNEVKLINHARKITNKEINNLRLSVTRKSFVLNKMVILWIIVR